MGLLALLLAAAVSGCAGEGGPLTPSPVIVPDAATIPVGGERIFVVYNGSVLDFTVTGTAHPIGDCVRLARLPGPPDGVQVSVMARCTDRLYLKADLGAEKSSLVAALTIP